MAEEQKYSDAGEAPKVKSTTKARQGVTGHNVRYVLAWGLGGAVILMAVAWVVFLR